MACPEFTPDNIEWKVIPGFEEYAVSSYGHVKRLTPSKGTYVGKILKSKKDPAGYDSYDLHRKGMVKRLHANRLVALAFLGAPPIETMEAAHKDGNHDNNHFSNLYWATHADNMKDMEKHGTIPHGEKHYKSFLSTEDILTIRHRFAQGDVTRETLAQEYGTTIRNIGGILRGDKRRREPGPLFQKFSKTGATHHSAKLTPESIRLIRRLYDAGGRTQSQLAFQFDVSDGMIYKIVNRLSWKHVKDEV